MNVEEIAAIVGACASVAGVIVRMTRTVSNQTDKIDALAENVGELSKHVIRETNESRLLRREMSRRITSLERRSEGYAKMKGIK